MSTLISEKTKLLLQAVLLVLPVLLLLVPPVVWLTANLLQLWGLWPDNLSGPDYLKPFLIGVPAGVALAYFQLKSVGKKVVAVRLVRLAVSVAILSVLGDIFFPGA
ncbi:MAG: hypothetical protein LPK19_02130 [Hymenobacteraceae bacterium]|nr:hypothetical protein [Hymenobacteraceae bacterium]MDX5394974.1 hypothetical protein [Hymenobacteraceae bacterium]MDX5511008.1 hypothetical protein [Hymenobacteraceae bacterium]